MLYQEQHQDLMTLLVRFNIASRKHDSIFCFNKKSAAVELMFHYNEIVNFIENINVLYVKKHIEDYITLKKIYDMSQKINYELLAKTYAEGFHNGKIYGENMNHETQDMELCMRSNNPYSEFLESPYYKFNDPYDKDIENDK